MNTTFVFILIHIKLLNGMKTQKHGKKDALSIKKGFSLIACNLKKIVKSRLNYIDIIAYHRTKSAWQILVARTTKCKIFAIGSLWIPYI